MEKIPGCWEHLSMVWHALKEARAQRSNLGTIWLDSLWVHPSQIYCFCFTCRWSLSTVDQIY